MIRMLWKQPLLTYYSNIALTFFSLLFILFGVFLYFMSNLYVPGLIFIILGGIIIFDIIMVYRFWVKPRYLFIKEKEIIYPKNLFFLNTYKTIKIETISKCEILYNKEKKPIEIQNIILFKQNKPCLNISSSQINGNLIELLNRLNMHNVKIEEITIDEYIKRLERL